MFYIETPEGNRVRVAEWQYLQDMSTKAFEHVVSQAGLVIYRKVAGKVRQ